jgi:carbon-monoxide dehydrogenase medium subunit
LSAVTFPKTKIGRRWGFQELARRHGDYAIVGLAAMIDGLTECRSAKLVFFGVEDRPVLARTASASLSGLVIDDAAISASQSVLADDLDPHGDLHADAATKLHLARVLTGRVLTSLREVPADGS